MRTLTFEIPIAPVAWARVKRGRYGQAYVPAKTKQFEIAVGQYARLVARMSRNELLVGPLILTARFILTPPRKRVRNHPHVRPDLDNYMKALKDGLVGVLYADDAQVCQYGPGTGKFYAMDGSPARIEIQLSEME